MRYLVLLRGTRLFDPPPGLMEGIVQLGRDATLAGALVETAGLAPSVSGAHVRLAAGQLGVVDSPFADSAELISYALYDVEDKADAVEWARRYLQLHRDLVPGWQGEAEVLKVFGPEDFAAPEA